MVKIMNKNRSDIEDKFCKFEIKKLLEGDETVSIISDTWSTDAVLASDSEMIDAHERNFATPLIPNNVILPGGYGLSDPIISNFRAPHLDETQSESNWSTDVLGSDSEKPTEVDVDDGSKPSELPSPDSLFYNPNSSTKEQNQVNAYLSDKLLDLETNDKSEVKSFVDNNEKITTKDIKESEVNDELNIIRSDSNIKNPFFNEDLENSSDFTVQHRKNVTIQRNSNFDSRRNGISPAVAANNSDLLNTKTFNVLDSAKVDAVNGSGKVMRASSGAIPKSISFDTTADKCDQYSPNKRGGILNKIKGLANMKGRKNRSNQQQDSENIFSRNNELEQKVFVSETTEDILGKYRRKVSTSSDPASSESAGSNSSST